MLFCVCAGFEYESDDEGDHDNDLRRHDGREERNRSALAGSQVLEVVY